MRQAQLNGLHPVQHKTEKQKTLHFDIDFSTPRALFLGFCSRSNAKQRKVHAPLKNDVAFLVVFTSMGTTSKLSPLVSRQRKSLQILAGLLLIPTNEAHGLQECAVNYCASVS